MEKMHLSVRTLCALASLSFLIPASGAMAATSYPDTTGESFAGSPNFLDIASVQVSNDATNITFTITTVGSFAAPNDWPKLLIGVNSVAGGKTDNGTRWDAGKPISMPAGMDYWVDTWVNFGGGGQVWKHNPIPANAASNGFDPTSTGSATSVIDGTSTSIALTFPLSAFGLSVGNEFDFDIWAAGGGPGDSANDASSNPDMSTTNWPGPYAANVLSHYVVVPEPVSIGFMGLAALVCMRRRSR